MEKDVGTDFAKFRSKYPLDMEALMQEETASEEFFTPGSTPVTDSSSFYSARSEDSLSRVEDSTEDSSSRVEDATEESSSRIEDSTVRNVEIGSLGGFVDIVAIPLYSTQVGVRGRQAGQSIFKGLVLGCIDVEFCK